MPKLATRESNSSLNDSADFFWADVNWRLLAVSPPVRQLFLNRQESIWLGASIDIASRPQSGAGRAAVKIGRTKAGFPSGTDGTLDSAQS